MIKRSLLLATLAVAAVIAAHPAPAHAGGTKNCMIHYFDAHRGQDICERYMISICDDGETVTDMGTVYC